MQNKRWAQAECVACCLELRNTMKRVNRSGRLRNTFQLESGWLRFNLNQSEASVGRRFQWNWVSPTAEQEDSFWSGFKYVKFSDPTRPKAAPVFQAREVKCQSSFPEPVERGPLKAGLKSETESGCITDPAEHPGPCVRSMQDEFNVIWQLCLEMFTLYSDLPGKHEQSRL